MMKNSALIKFILFAFLVTGAPQTALFPLSADNGVEKSSGSQEKIAIAVLYPSLGTIKELAALRENGLINIPHLSVLGLYHEKELTDYSKAQEFVRANNLDWISFHPLSGPLAEDTLFQKNSCSEEFEKIFRESDGIIFFGGPDMPPSLYREKTNLLTKIEDPYRHWLELSFIFHLLGGFQGASFKPFLESRPGFPILGICLGSQSLNVGTGGTLTQDMWSEVYGKKYVEDVLKLGSDKWHRNPFSDLMPQENLTSFVLHAIKLEADGKFCTAMGFSPKDTPYTYSSHHQQAKKLGKGFRVSATSLDGKIVEAIEHERYPNVLGVQFHPEAANLYLPQAGVRFNPRDEEPVNLKSFLEKHPPSLAFHQKLWAWVSQKWMENCLEASRIP